MKAFDHFHESNLQLIIVILLLSRQFITTVMMNNFLNIHHVLSLIPLHCIPSHFHNAHHSTFIHCLISRLSLAFTPYRSLITISIGYIVHHLVA